MPLAQALKFLQHRLPPGRSGVEALIVPFFLDESFAVFEDQLDPARHLFRKSLAILLLWSHTDLSQQRLDIGPSNALQSVLIWHNLPVQQRRRHDVRKTVVG